MLQLGGGVCTRPGARCAVCCHLHRGSRGYTRLCSGRTLVEERWRPLVVTEGRGRSGLLGISPVESTCRNIPEWLLQPRAQGLPGLACGHSRGGGTGLVATGRPSGSGSCKGNAHGVELEEGAGDAGSGAYVGVMGRVRALAFRTLSASGQGRDSVSDRVAKTLFSRREGRVPCWQNISRMAIRLLRPRKWWGRWVAWY